MMLTIAGIAAAAAIFNAIFPALSRSSGAIVQAGANVDDRLKSDVAIIHAVGELDSSGSFSDTNGNARFEIFVWAKNVGTTRILDITSTDVFVGQPGNFVRIPHETEVESGVWPRWSHSLESGATEWGPKVTLKITAKYADEWNVWGTVDTLAAKMKILDQHCDDVGRDPTQIKRTAVALLFMSEDEKYLAKMRDADMQQATIIGTPAEVGEIVAKYESIGVDELIVPDFTLGEDSKKIATLDQFITDVAGR